MYDSSMKTPRTPPPYDQGVAIRTAPISRRALSRVTAELKNTELRFFGGKITQEAIVNASWLLLETYDEQELVNILGPFLERLEASMSATVEIDSTDVESILAPRPDAQYSRVIQSREGNPHLLKQIQEATRPKKVDGKGRPRQQPAPKESLPINPPEAGGTVSPSRDTVTGKILPPKGQDRDKRQSS